MNNFYYDYKIIKLTTFISTKASIVIMETKINIRSHERHMLITVTYGAASPVL